jgi:hypothetical protein
MVLAHSWMTKLMKITYKIQKIVETIRLKIFPGYLTLQFLQNHIK